MNTLKKILVSLITVLMLLTSCTDPVDTTPKGALTVEVGTYEGAASYKAMIDNKPVDIVEGKAIIISDDADYDVYVTALDKEGNVIADFYNRVALKCNESYKVSLKAVDASRNFTILNMYLDSGVYCKGGVITLNKDFTCAKAVVTLDTGALFPPMAGEPDIGVEPIPPVMIAEGTSPTEPMVLEFKEGKYNIVGNTYTLAFNDGTEEIYTFEDNALKSNDTSDIFSELIGDFGGAVEEDYWSLPVIFLPKDVVNGFLANVFTESKIKNPVVFNEDPKLNSGLVMKDGILELYLDFTIDSNFINNTLTTAEPLKTGFRIKLPLEYEKEADGVIKILTPNFLNIVNLKRWEGGSIMTIGLQIHSSEEPLELMLARKYTGNDIKGEPFAEDTTINMVKTNAQLQSIVEEAEVMTLFIDAVTPKISTEIYENQNVYKSVRGNWKCTDPKDNHEFDLSVNFFDDIRNDKYGRCINFSSNEFIHPVPTDLTFIDDNGVKTIIHLENTVIDATSSCTVDKIYTDISVLDFEGNVIEECSKYYFVRNDINDGIDAFTCLNNLVGENPTGLKAIFGKDGKQYMEELGVREFTGTRYMKTADTIYMYFDDIGLFKPIEPEGPDAVIRSVKAEPEESSLKVSAYVQFPFDENNKRIDMIKGIDSNTVYSVVLD